MPSEKLLLPSLFTTTQAKRNHAPNWRINAIYAVIMVALVAVFLADSFTKLGVVVWVLYLLPLMLTLFVWRPALPVCVAGIITVCMTYNFYTEYEGVERSIAQVNRLMGFVSIWGMALVAYFFIVNKLATRKAEWHKAGMAALSLEINGEQTLQELGGNILGFLVKYLDAQVGAIYIRQEGNFFCAASYAVPANSLPETFTTDDGLLGQAVKDKQSFFVHDVPENYFTTGSAFGAMKPRHLLIAPAFADNKVSAVIELGFLYDYDEEARAFLKEASEAIAISVQSANYRNNLQRYLEETQRQSEELQAQSEELRVANEELEEQSHSLQESQSRLEQQQAEMEQTNVQLEEQTQMLEKQRDELAAAKADLLLRARELEEASQYKSDFLANMSHELRTPLNSTLILAKLLSDNPDENLTDEQVGYAETIYASGNDLLYLINDILDLSKIEAGHMEIQSEDVDVDQVMEDLSRSFKPMAIEKNVDLVMSRKKSAPASIVTDVKRLEQILKNLLSNALKFTSQGEIGLTVKAKGKDKICFEVHDTGIGISKEQQAIIFDAFRQADGTTNRKYGGTGLGLSITRELTRLLGGEIDVESTEGKGSVFTVTIPRHYSADAVAPRAKAAPTPVHTAPSETAKGDYAYDDVKPAKKQAKSQVTFNDDRDQLDGSKRVLLIVEDDEKFSKIISDIAHELDFQCLIAHTADDALSTALEFIPHAVILDIGLPDHSGLSVLDRLKQDSRTRHIPVHVVSGDDHSRTAMALGAVGYEIKPVKRQQLVKTLQQMETRLTQNMRRVLLVEDDEVQQKSMLKLLGNNKVDAVAVGTAAECLELLSKETFDCMVLDISLPDASGFTLLETLSKEENYSFPPVIVYTGRDLSRTEEEKLRRYSQSIIIKGAKSPERLLDEVTLFLHQVVSDLPAEQQRMLKKAKNRDTIIEGRRILVVEDDIRNVYALTSIFEPRGATIQIARNGLEALEALEKVKSNDNTPPIDLVLMDVMMPEMDGLTATHEIRKDDTWKGLPIIMLTAKAMKGDQERCIKAGANDYMSKPLDVEKLLSLVRVWMPR